MKTIISILLSFWVFFQTVGFELNDVVQLELLVEHIEYHSENYGDDFFTFFEKHYGSSSLEHQKDNKDEKSQHDNLPFQHLSCSHLSPEVILISLRILFFETLVESSLGLNSFYKNLYSSIEKLSIFHPPKFI